MQIPVIPALIEPNVTAEIADWPFFMKISQCGRYLIYPFQISIVAINN